MHIPAGYAQVTLEFTGVAVPFGAAVVIGVDNSADVVPSTGLTAVVNAYENRFNPAVANTCTLTRGIWKEGPNTTGLYYEQAYAAQGNSANAAGYAGACYLMRKGTALGGRSGRGRMFLPGVPEASIDPGGALSAGTTTGMDTAGAAFLADLDAADIPMVLLHESELLIPQPVLTLTCSPRAATQRRRQNR